MVNYKVQGNVALIEIDNGKVNALSPAVIAAFNECLDKAEADAKAVVFTGSPGILSGGYDLTVMQQGIEAARELVNAGSCLTRRLLAFPYPVVAACNGHAIAKGAFLLLASDYRIGVAGDFKISLNEVAIGMTMHHVGIELCRGRLAPMYINRAVINAEVFNPEGAINAGFLDGTVADQAELQAAAMAQAEQMMSLNLPAFKATKLKSRRQWLEKLDWAIAEDYAAKPLP